MRRNLCRRVFEGDPDRFGDRIDNLDARSPLVVFPLSWRLGRSCDRPFLYPPRFPCHRLWRALRAWNRWSGRHRVLLADWLAASVAVATPGNSYTWRCHPAAMTHIRIDSLVRDQIEAGKDDEAVLRSVRTRIGQLEKNGVNLDWSAFKPTNHFWFEGMSRGRDGRKLGRRATQSAITEYMIDSIIESVRKEMAKARQLPEVFVDTEQELRQEPLASKSGSSRSSRNVTTKDPTSILFATNARDIRSHDPNELFRQLTPILWKISGEVLTRWQLPVVERDDLFQAARERIWRKLPTYQGRGWFKSWAATLARNAMIDYASHQPPQIATTLDEEQATTDRDHDEILDLHTALRSARGRAPGPSPPSRRIHRDGARGHPGLQPGKPSGLDETVPRASRHASPRHLRPFPVFAIRAQTSSTSHYKSSWTRPTDRPPRHPRVPSTERERHPAQGQR